MDKAFFSSTRTSLPKTTIYQDNKSTILLAENGKSSSSKRTRNINIRYFFVADKIKKGEVNVVSSSIDFSQHEKSFSTGVRSLNLFMITFLTYMLGYAKIKKFLIISLDVSRRYNRKIGRLLFDIRVVKSSKSFRIKFIMTLF